MSEAKKIGRPTKHPEGRATNNLTFRTRGGLRDKLAEAATSTGRSISEEIEYRLERSFDLPAFAEEVANQVVRKLQEKD